MEEKEAKRRAVAVLASDAGCVAKRSPVKAELSRKGSPLNLRSLELELERLERDAVAFRERSRPLLDGGEGKLEQFQSFAYLGEWARGTLRSSA